MPFYTSEQILNQALDEATGTLKTSGGSGAASATAANQTTTNDRLGTPGTGEPAHAGGSTGLIGWARDILAKIAAFGTSAAPSADVLSVQYPNTYVGKATISAMNQALTVDTLGASQIAFNLPQGSQGAVIFEGINSNATTPAWAALRCLSEGTFGPVYSSPGSVYISAGGTFRADCAGLTQIRARAATYLSSYEILAHRIYSPGLIPAVTEPSNVSSNSIYTILGTGAYYTDTTTPLAANATFTGSSRTMSIGNHRFNASFYTNTNSVAGGCIVESSVDGGSVWLPEPQSAAAIVNGSVIPVATISVIRTAPQYRVKLIQSATPAGTTRVTSSQTPN